MKKKTRPSTKLRANGNYIDNSDHFPFVLRLSKHERIFSHTLSWKVEKLSPQLMALLVDSQEDFALFYPVPVRIASSLLPPMGDL